eukprot:12917291-Prorocentrum_lima.AAC.1
MDVKKTSTQSNSDDDIGEVDAPDFEMVSTAASWGITTTNPLFNTSKLLPGTTRLGQLLLPTK